MNQILQKVTEYELSIPRMDTEIDEQMIYDKMKGRWESISEWFSGKDGMESEAGKVFDTTNEIIRKITRYATRISEMSNQGSNRREEYKKLADIFGKCRDINEAHRLSAVVFGIEKPLHLKGELSRETDSINSGVYEEEAYAVTVTPRVRTYKQKARRSGIVDRSKEKEEMRLLMIRRLEEERKLLGSYIHNGRLEFASLPVIEPSVRDMFLLWLSKALERKNHRAKTKAMKWEAIIQKSGNWPGQSYMNWNDSFLRIEWYWSEICRKSRRICIRQKQSWKSGKIKRILNQNSRIV